MSDSHQESSSACPETHAQADSPGLFQNGELTFQAHHVGWIICGFFAIIATSVSVWLIVKHLSNYTNKRQQRQIVRLLLMVPVYSIISLLAYLFWDYAIPLSLVRDAYEGVLLAAFFYLLLEYLAPTPAEQREYFRKYQLKKWAWPLGRVKSKPSGLKFLQIMKWAILQYCWIRPLSTVAAIILNFQGLYCEISWSPRFAYIHILIVISISVTVAMYALIQFYMSISSRIKQHRPILQLFSIKAIIFLMFWQGAFLSLLHSLHVIKDTKYMTAEEINVGFAALLQTFEMVLFAFLHVRCFSYIPYRAEPGMQTSKRLALKHALDFRDYWRETKDGSVYAWRSMKGKETDLDARRQTHLERAMGRGRSLPGATGSAGIEKQPKEKPTSSIKDPRAKRQSERSRSYYEPFSPSEIQPLATSMFTVTNSAQRRGHVDDEADDLDPKPKARGFFSKLATLWSKDPVIKPRDPLYDTRLGTPPPARLHLNHPALLDLDDAPPPSRLVMGRNHRDRSNPDDDVGVQGARAAQNPEPPVDHGQDLLLRKDSLLARVFSQPMSDDDHHPFDPPFEPPAASRRREQEPLPPRELPPVPLQADSADSGNGVQVHVPPSLEPVHPTPVLHHSVSLAHRPQVLDRQDWLTTEASGSHSRRPPGPPLQPPDIHSSRNRTHGRPSKPTKRGPRPRQIVMPTPLSPARFPGPSFQQAQPQHRAETREHGMRGPRHRSNPPPLNMPDHYSPMQPYSGAIVGPNTSAYQFPEVASPEVGRSARTERSQTHSNSRFGIEPAVSSVESLPRHPALRRHTARVRRESQPLPPPPEGEFGLPQHDHMYDGPANVTVDAMPLLSSPEPLSPSSLNGDSRYPITRHNHYFDRPPQIFHSPTHVMTPNVPLYSEPVVPAPSRRLKRR